MQDADREPLPELLVELRTSLTKLLATVHTDPWSLLMVQTLLWSFRRWAIYYLTLDEFMGALEDYLWESHLELVETFAPNGLKEFGLVWLRPTNIGDRIDFLQELNDYFIFLVKQLDAAILEENDANQSLLATFLDETITEILQEWLAGRDQYRIYPVGEESVDNFPPGRIFSIMQLILEKHAVAAVAAPAPAVPAVPAEEAPEPPVSAPPTEPAAAAPPELPSEPPTVAAPSEPPKPEPEPEPAKPEPSTVPSTVRSALRFRRTMRVQGRRAGPPRRDGTTRKHK